MTATCHSLIDAGNSINSCTKDEVRDKGRQARTVPGPLETYRYAS